MKAVLLQPAYVLHRRDYRESSLLVELFTQEYGRVTVIAKGGRKPSSSLYGLLQPFLPVLVSWSGKSELKTLTHIELHLSSHVKPLLGDNLFAGFYLNELLMYLLQKWDPHPKLFFVYMQTLTALQSLRLQQKTLRLFEKRLLDEIGYGLLQSFLPDQFYHFIPEQGFAIVREEQGIPSYLDRRYIFSGKNLLAIAREELSDENLLDAKRLMRIILAPLLGARMIYSRQLFASRVD